MNQNNIRQHNGTIFSVTEAVAWLKELDDRTKSNQTDYNSIDELANKVKDNEGFENNGITILTPKDATLSLTSNTTGAIKIHLPITPSSTMIKLFVEIYDYSNNESISLIISGQDFLTAWYCTSTQIIASKTDRNFTVRFGKDGTKSCIYIGELNSTWNFLKVAIIKGIFGYSNFEPSKWLTGWNISLESSSFQNITKTHTNNLPVAQ